MSQTEPRRIEHDIQFPKDLFEFMRGYNEEYIKVVTQSAFPADGKPQAVVFHQSAFPKFNEDIEGASDEMAYIAGIVKLAGALGVEVRFIGKNGEPPPVV